MKAFLLAGGLGTRLRPLTDTTPKCMLAIDGQPMLEIWLATLARAGVDEVLVNLHHLPEVVTAYLASRAVAPAVRTSWEPELLGSAGTLLANRDWVGGEDFFLACYADNLTDFDMGALVAAHRGGAYLATIGVFHAPNPSACGIVELGPGQRVVGFVEKPAHPASDLANAGLYAFNPGVLDLVERPAPCDIGFDLLPHLVGRAQAITVEGYFRDIGTPEAYRLAQEEWASRAVA